MGNARIQGLPFVVKDETGRQALTVSIKGNFEPEIVAIASEGTSLLYFTSTLGEYQKWPTGDFFISASGCYLRES